MQVTPTSTGHTPQSLLINGKKLLLSTEGQSKQANVYLLEEENFSEHEAPKRDTTHKYSQPMQGISAKGWLNKGIMKQETELQLQLLAWH